MFGVDKKRKKSIKMERIITSLLETDMYKFSMGQAIYHQFSDYKTTWSFKCRNTDVFFTKEMVDEIKRQIQLYCDLRFTEEELEYLHNIKWIKGSYVDFLRLWKARYEDFEISDDAECGLKIEARGTWLNTSMYEIPTLAIVNEVYFRMNDDYDKLLASFRQKKIMDLFMDDRIDEESDAEFAAEKLDSMYNTELFSFDIKKLAGFGKGGEKGFEGTMTQLQMQTYLCACDFRKRLNKKGAEYGWNVAVYSMPEKLWGYDHVTSAYGESPEKSWERIVKHMDDIYPIATEKQIKKVLK